MMEVASAGARERAEGDARFTLERVLETTENFMFLSVMISS